ncbi:MAG: cupin domain-containing protein [Bacteroidota bacterium]
MYFVNKSELEVFNLLPGFRGKMIHTEKVTIADFQIDAGAVLPDHQHPHEQISTVLEGEFEFVIGGELHRCHAGMVAIIPSNTSHSGKAITDCRIMDVFCPAREDYQ